MEVDDAVKSAASSTGRRAWIQTWGCQMNDADSAEIKRRLLGLGFTITPRETEADLLILNTCTVRRKAEEAVFNQLDHFKNYKRRRPGVVIGVVGCMGASSRDEIEARTPFVDFILPPHQADTLEQIVSMRFPGGVEGETGEDLDPSATPFRGMVNISRGCNNNCTFCIVPSVRGREECFSPEEIERQIARLLEGGAQEILLLGQNVNSYRYEGMEFAELIQRVCPKFPETGFRFTSPHPKDFSVKFIEAMAGLPNMMRHVHFPLQSGSDTVLRLMKRSYTAQRFKDRVAKLREVMPGIAMSTDVIAGFPGETEEDFQATLDVVREMRFDSAYLFYYSPRQGTAALDLPGHLPEEVRKERLSRLIEVQLKITREQNAACVGRTEAVLVEKPARKPEGHMVGRLASNRLVIFPGESTMIGKRAQVTITGSGQVALFGRLTPPSPGL